MTARCYTCRRIAEPITINGALDDPAWAALPWTDDFIDITGDPELRPRYQTRIKMAWDEEFFYVGAEMEEPHVWGSITGDNAIIFEDNDSEVFIDPDGDGLNYCEFEITALGTIWELSLPRPYGDGGIPVLAATSRG